MEQQQQVLHEMNQVAAMITSLYNPVKLNIGALGNVVSQLHIHVLGRFTNDPAWPNPVWGQLAANAYSEAQLEQQLTHIRACLQAWIEQVKPHLPGHRRGCRPNGWDKSTG